MGTRKVVTGWKRVRWTNQMREIFFNTLAETCNIMASAEAAGIKSQNVYEKKRKDPAFAEEWHRALECGYEVLETKLVGIALSGDESRTIDNGAHGKIDTDLAMRMLTQHRNAMNGRVRGGGPEMRKATREDTDRAILAKLDAMARHRGAKLGEAGQGKVEQGKLEQGKAGRDEAEQGNAEPGE
ncbi:hypothetical protein [Sphingomonas sp.]|uniref:hypothetical protein n=1 Tax=Sphingomonas sp. TaxID=28214 RepID=UPI001B254771|nr:hypothetical protein [Sphingomonas sp.]MBO9715062.1 hypothetical protein [Sphingomonas sp.]